MPRFDPDHPAITARIAAEIAAHEGIVKEAYLDSVGVWTWGLGITDASGHHVERYRDNPQTLARCLEVYCWALEKNYAPAVVAAFEGHRLAEHEFAAALSFQWNTGAIRRAQWVQLYREGKRDAARRAIMNWCNPPALTERRRREQVLFFDGKWSGDGTALLFDVAKPRYQPRGGRRVAIMEPLNRLLSAPAPRPDTRIAEDAADDTSCPPTNENWFTRLFARS